MTSQDFELEKLTCWCFQVISKAFTIFPAVLNALSDGTDVAGMHKYFHAKLAKRGNWVK